MLVLRKIHNSTRQERRHWERGAVFLVRQLTCDATCCEEVGKEPEKEYKGSFNVRVKPALHRKLAEYSSKNGESLNRTVEKAIEAYIA